MFNHNCDVVDKDFYIKSDNYYKLVRGDIFGMNIWFEKSILKKGSHRFLDTVIALRQRMYRYNYKHSKVDKKQSKGRVNTVFTINTEEGMIEIFAKLTWRERFLLNARINNTLYYKDPIKFWSYAVGGTTVLFTMFFTIYNHIMRYF